MRIGSHVSMKANGYLVGSVEEMQSYNANAMMIYTGAPQNAKRVPLEQLRIEEATAKLTELGLSWSDVIVHAPYLINLANVNKVATFQLGVDLLKQELQRTEAIGAKVLVLHPGAAVGADRKDALRQCAKGLNEVLDDDGTVRIALETMAGKGSEIGISFEELHMIVSQLHRPERVGVCMDTCHLHDGGYDVCDFDGVIHDFLKYFTLSDLLCIHVNDSKNSRGSHKDRHANIGYGEIGFDALNRIVHHPLLDETIKILETPYVDERAPYRYEIENFRKQSFVDFIAGWDACETL